MKQIQLEFDGVWDDYHIITVPPYQDIRLVDDDKPTTKIKKLDRTVREAGPNQDSINKLIGEGLTETRDKLDEVIDIVRKLQEAL